MAQRTTETTPANGTGNKFTAHSKCSGSFPDKLSFQLQKRIVVFGSKEKKRLNGLTTIKTIEQIITMIYITPNLVGDCTNSDVDATLPEAWG